MNIHTKFQINSSKTAIEIKKKMAFKFPPAFVQITTNGLFLYF